MNMKFVDLCETAHNSMKAWKRHIKLFPQFLRLRQNYTLVSYSSDLGTGRAQKEGYNLDVRDQPPKDKYNHKIASSQILGKQLAQKVNNTEAEETVQALSEVALSVRSRKDKLEMMEDSTELANHTKENSIRVLESVHELSSQSEQDKFGTVDIVAELANQTKENTSSPQESTRDFGKSSRINELELGRKFKLRKLSSPEMESQLPRSNDNSNSTDTPLLLNESEKDGSLNHQNSTFMEMHEDKLPDQARPPPRTASTGQSPLAVSPDSHPEQNTKRSALLTAEQSLAMSQMLQYYQQQYQQQQPYPQMQQQYMNQQMYQLQPAQQHIQMANQQNYVQQQQIQSLPYPMQQNIQSFQNYGYQQQDAAQGNQILWQQYQQYQQDYQNLQHQPQSQGGHLYMQEQNPQQLSTEKEQEPKTRRANYTDKVRLSCFLSKVKTYLYRPSLQ